MAYKSRTPILVVLLTAGLLATVYGCGCSGSSAAAPAVQPPAPPPTPAGVPSFDGDRALELLRQQCALGPRNPGSRGHEQMLAWLVNQLKQFTSRVAEQHFQAKTAFGGPYPFCNVVAWLGPDEGEALLLAAHWDTRPVADEDPDPANRDKPILGANDGASGVAVLLEMTRLMADTPPPMPVIVAFLDAEDSGKAGSDLPYMGFCLGAEYLANHPIADWPQPTQGILVDLVGGDGKTVARIPLQPFHGNPAFDLRLEDNSLDANPHLVNLVWSTAEELGHQAFVRQTCGAITDDHVPFIKAGIPMIDIIEVFPVVWHTLDDTPAHCSADSLHQVGDTLMHVIYRKL